ncbi:hypothetical protein C6P45_004950 [Maudiozyma exigua]|uniref:Zn(2)-C6 fungal-type domain-containing protein n=1 Tax=Maudiozyma exigua TaxID=34358 RepID=A0A9P6W9I6_MAUEX|nr:hypothetical protein C6P45_004950 [Kazachstania exigua]
MNSSNENSPAMSNGVEKKRIRVTKACEHCKRRKVKCDGTYPCKICVSHNLQCNYDYTTGKPRGKYKKKTNKIEKIVTNDGINTQSATNVNGVYVEDQTAKLLLQLGSNLNNSNVSNLKDANTMEYNDTSNNDSKLSTPSSDISRIASIGNILGTHSKHPSTTESKSSRSPWFCYSYEKYRFHTRYQNVLPFLFGKSSISNLSDFIIKSNNLEIPRVQNYGWNMSGGHYLKLKTLNNHDLQTDTILNFDNVLHISIVQKLLSYYFDSVNKPLSIIHEKMFWQQFNNGFLQQRKTQNNKSAKLFVSILYLILTIAIRFHDGEAKSPIDFTTEERDFLAQNTKRLENYLFSYAYTVVTKLTFEWESFELIQSWLLIAFYLRTSHRQIATWNALSKAITMCKGMSLELGILPDKHMPGDFMKSWHCFWLCFIMDKLISFQVGRKYQLDLPGDAMANPRVHYSDVMENDKDIWFQEETIQMYELALFITRYQRPNGQELNIEESNSFRTDLKKWLSRQLQGNLYNLMTNTTDFKPWQIQPFLTYLDIRLTFESKSVFCLLNPPENHTKDNVFEFSIDYDSLITTGELALTILETVNKKERYFIPWWLNLSVLFTVSVTNLVMVHSGIRSSNSKANLDRCMTLWNVLESTTSKNPPSMLVQCVWCLKMLNYISCLRLVNTATILNEVIGVNLGDNSPNKNNFHQFSKDGEDQVDEETVNEPAHVPVPNTTPVPSHLSRLSETVVPNPSSQTQLLNLLAPVPEVNMTYPNVRDQTPAANSNSNSGLMNGTVNSTPSDFLEDDLFANLQWFDQTFI